ncbi:MAG: AAA family ATPase [Symploca sp. SIO3C6]|uniref:AAA family ATPase n=1 Tax=Symploca sp. SIO1C4 TaxID=2607765 RepID=A0A6B3NM83_9CYAN|nr:AAA family ATPase [Symploca sp. SIO3C6]NER31334.1 AAA family ATPase [Symploca sp. SIO1C4]
MIISLYLINFKPFENQVFDLKPLTLLSGLNSTGKSSVLQSLLLLRQSYQQGLLPKIGLALNGDLVNIGTAQDALFEGAKEDSISFKISWKNSPEGIWSFNYDREVDVLTLASQPVAPEIYKSSLFENNFQYLQAERIGPRPSFNMSDFQVRQLKQINLDNFLQFKQDLLQLSPGNLVPFIHRFYRVNNFPF